MNPLPLQYRPPLDWSALLAFLAARATPGVESVEGGVYRRTVRSGDGAGIIEVSHGARGGELLVRSRHLPATALPELTRRLERLFDLAADSSTISARLSSDPVLAPMVESYAGIRVPGSWDPFETAVRAIIGQVVSVKVATTLTGRLAARLGEPLPAEDHLLTRLYPTAERVARADLTGLGLSGQKIATIGTLARAVASGSLGFDAFESPEEALERLQQLPGIGPWTAHYIAMRALGHQDAFPAGDLILRRAAAPEYGEALTEKELNARAESWRPYRAYAAMLLWASYSRRMEMSKLEKAESVKTRAERFRR